MTSQVLCSNCQKKVNLSDIDPDDESCPYCRTVVTLSGNGTLSGSGTLNDHGTLHESPSLNENSPSAITELLWDRESSRSPTATKPSLQTAPSSVVEDHAKVRELCRAILKENPMFAPHIDSVLQKGEKLGEGGMGAVFRVKDRRLGRDAALKILTDEDPDPSMIQRFMREAKITARLDHPRVPPIYDAGMGADGHFLLMRLIAGQTMKDLIAELHSRESAPQASEYRPLLEALHKVSETIAYAHSRGILHRDVKPANIMIGAFGEVMVMDWGLARDLSEDSGRDSFFRSQVSKLSSDEYGTDDAVTRAGAIVGTPGYMSPEQAAGSEVNELTDVFALGAILTEILTGQAPVEGKTLLKKVMNTLNGVWVLPGERRKSVPNELNDLARVTLTLDPKARIASADLFAHELHAYLTGEELTVRRYSPLERSERWIRRNPGYVLALSLAAVFIAFVSIFAAQLQRSENARLDALRISAENRKQLLEEETARSFAEQRAKRKSWQAAQAEQQASRARKVIKFFTKARDAARRRAPETEITKLIKTALEASQQSFPALLTAAEIYRDGQLIPQAKAILERASTTFSPAYEALFMLHNIERKESKEKSALQMTPALNRLIRRAQERSDVNQFVYFAYGSELAHSGKLVEAIKCYDAVEQFSTGMPELYLLRGDAKMLLGQVDAAIKDYDRSIELDPQLSRPWNNRGFARLHRAKFKAALADFNKAIALDASNFEYYFNRGLTQGELGQNKTALEDFRLALELNPTDTVIHANMALAYTKLFRYKEALAVIQSGLKIAPEHGRLYGLRGYIHFNEERPTKAVADFNKAIQFAPNDNGDKAELYVKRGRAWSSLKEWDKAFADFETALKLSPEDPVIYSNRGAVRGAKGDYQEALADLAYAERLNPDIPQVYLNRGMIYGLMNRHEEAVRWYSHSLSLDGGNFEAYYNRATSYHRLKMFAKAKPDYDQAAKLNSQNPSVLFNRGSNSLALKEWKDAIDNYSRAIAIDSKFVKAYYNRGVAWQRQGQFELARKDYEKAIELDPTYINAYFNRATLRAQIGDNPGSIVDYSQVLKLDPNHHEAFLNRGVQYARSKQFFKALRDYDHFIDMCPGVAAAHVNRGSTRSKLGMIRGAIKDWEEALKIDPKNVRAPQLKAGIKQLKDWIAANPGYSYEKHGKKEQSSGSN